MLLTVLTLFEQVFFERYKAGGGLTVIFSEITSSRTQDSFLRFIVLRFKKGRNIKVNILAKSNPEGGG